MRSKVFPQEAGARCVALVKGQVAKQNHVALRVHSEARFLGWFWCFLVGLDCEDKSERTRTDSETLVFMKKNGPSYHTKVRCQKACEDCLVSEVLKVYVEGIPIVQELVFLLPSIMNHASRFKSIQKSSIFCMKLHEILWTYMQLHLDINSINY